jgi:hypothetical protein
MSLTADHVHAALAHALAEHAYHELEQAFALPVSVLTVDHLAPHLQGAAGRELTLCVSGMVEAEPKAGEPPKKKSEATLWRNKIAANADGRYLKNVNIDKNEILVDLNLLAGPAHPYDTLLTAESEAYAGHANYLYGRAESTDNGFLWDFSKLLLVPSPVRLMFTRCAVKHQAALLNGLNTLVQQYSGRPSGLAADADLWSISFPVESMREAKVAIHRWAPNAHGAGPVDHSKLFPA